MYIEHLFRIVTKNTSPPFAFANAFPLNSETEH